MHGTLTTTKAKPRTADHVTGQFIAGSFLKIVAKLERADETVSAMLQRQAAALYFAAATTIRNNEGRLNAGATEPCERREEDDGRETVTKLARGQARGKGIFLGSG